MYRVRHKDYNYFTGGKHHGSKYNDNPILRWINNGFFESLTEFVGRTGAKRIYEIGCGEGQLLGVLYSYGYEVAGCDSDQESVDMTNENFAKIAGGVVASLGNLYEITAHDEQIQNNMIICCEVLEHVSDPEKGVQIIAECTDDYFIVSVPHEPLWRILNMVRGKYWTSFGNTPGHINHWTKNGFIRMISKYADIIAVSTPIPWTMILARKRRKIDDGE